MKFAQLAAALLVAGALNQPVMAQARVLELGHEASPGMVRMPDSSTGELTLQTCVTCKVLRLRANEQTRYVIQGTQVSLAEFARYLESNPTAQLVVMQFKDTTTLSRVVVTGKPGAR
jgi:hypothetical protein